VLVGAGEVLVVLGGFDGDGIERGGGAALPHEVVELLALDGALEADPPQPLPVGGLVGAAGDLEPEAGPVVERFREDVETAANGVVEGGGAGRERDGVQFGAAAAEQ